MELVHKAENALEEPFNSLPPLPNETRRGLASIVPWLALIAGVFQLASAWWLYSWANRADDLVDAANAFSRAFGGPTVNAGLTIWVWLGIAFLAASGVIMLLAFPKLQKKAKDGWDLLLLGILVGLVYGIVSAFIDGRGGLGTLLAVLIGSAVSVYLLFQVREFFGGKALKEKQ